MFIYKLVFYNSIKPKGDENMHKTQFITFAFIAMMLMAGVNGIGQIRFLDDIFSPGSEVEMHTNIINRGTQDVEDVRMTVYIPELGLYIPYRGIDIDEGSSYGKMMFFDLEDDVEPGEYLVRVRSFSKDHRTSTYRHITIV